MDIEEFKARFDNEPVINRIIDTHCNVEMSDQAALDVVHLEVGKIMNTLIHNCEF